MDRRKRTARTVALMSLFSMTDVQENVPVASFIGDGSDLVSLITGIDPVQDLHGYDNPWPAGGGKNKLIECVPGTYTGTNCQAVVSADGTITLSGTSGSSSEQINIPLKAKITTPSEQFYVHLFNTVNAKIAPAFELSTDIAGTTFYAACAPANRIFTVSTDRFGIEIDRVRVWIPADIDVACTFHPMFALTNSVVPWTPYSNICPISGWTEANIYVSPTTDAEDGTTYSITFPAEAGTVYGGTLNVTMGLLTLDKVNIPSYNGETLPGEWISDRDVYTPGGTPTIGAQVVYELATPLVYNLTPTEINTLLGTNNIWADTGEIKYIEYNV